MNVSAFTTAVSTTAKLACLWIGAIAPLSLGPSSQAIPHVYDITIDVTAGSLDGNRFTGTICYDDEFLMGMGSEIVTPYLGLRSTMDFLGKTYSETDDTDFPEFPQLLIKDGELEQLDFWVESENRGSWWDTPGWDIQLVKRQNVTTSPERCQ